jgi:hypothetical protein
MVLTLDTTLRIGIARSAADVLGTVELGMADPDDRRQMAALWPMPARR